jgi:peptide/nickel transport system permease protein
VIVVRRLGKRLFLTLLTLWLVATLIFFLAEVLPGDLGRTLLGPEATPAQVAHLDAQLGVNRPLLTQYISWLGNVVHGNWGKSYLTQQSVLSVVVSRLGNSMLLAAFSLLMVIPLALIAGTVAALSRDRFADRAITVGAQGLIAIPEFVSAIILLLIFSVVFHVFPTDAQIPSGAGVPDALSHIFLPAVTAGVFVFAYFTRMVREGMIDALSSAYARTAVLKGVPRRTVVWKHAFRNALLPTVAVIGAQIGGFGSLVVIESIFDYPGIGRLILQSANGHDVPMLEGAVLAVALVFILANLGADILYGVLDPRIRRRRQVA